MAFYMDYRGSTTYPIPNRIAPFADTVEKQRIALLHQKLGFLAALIKARGRGGGELRV